MVTVREIVGWGVNDPGTDERAAYDFFCVYRVPSVEFQRAFEQKSALPAGMTILTK